MESTKFILLALVCLLVIEMTSAAKGGIKGSNGKGKGNNGNGGGNNGNGGNCDLDSDCDEDRFCTEWCNPAGKNCRDRCLPKCVPSCVNGECKQKRDLPQNKWMTECVCDAGFEGEACDVST